MATAQTTTAASDKPASFRNFTPDLHEFVVGRFLSGNCGASLKLLRQKFDQGATLRKPCYPGQTVLLMTDFTDQRERAVEIDGIVAGVVKGWLHTALIRDLPPFACRTSSSRRP